MNEPAVVLEQVSVTYVGSSAPTLRGVDVAIAEGDLALVIGRTGSGKSTLLGTMTGAVPHFTGGRLSGRVLLAGRDTRTHRPRDLAGVVGVVGQDPLAGFVTDTVEEELAYAMEQLGLSQTVMRKRVEEVLDVMGIAELRQVALRELSGGQQQRVAIGSVLTSHPRLLVLDEPTSALDPTGAEEVLATITRLVHDLAVTVVVAEHRLERVVQYADTVLHVGRDGVVVQGAPAEVLRTSDVAPPVVELGRWAGVSPLPLSIRDARRRAIRLRAALADAPPPLPHRPGPARTTIEARGVTVRHGSVIAVADVDLSVRGGEITALMGRNGAGKSSLLWALQGAVRVEQGMVEVRGISDARDGGGVPHSGGARDIRLLTPAQRRRIVALVPQTPGDLLYLDTVAAECTRADADADADATVPAGRCAHLLASLAPGVLPDTHPRDLSEGQRLALVLAIQLTADPPVVLLDEPTRGLDYEGKHTLQGILRHLAERGRAVAVATHDVEFVAGCADRVVVMASGEVVSDGPTREIVVASPAFAPQVAKITSPGPWLTLADVRAALPDGAP